MLKATCEWLNGCPALSLNADISCKACDAVIHFGLLVFNHRRNGYLFLIATIGELAATFLTKMTSNGQFLVTNYKDAAKLLMNGSKWISMADFAYDSSMEYEATTLLFESTDSNLSANSSVFNLQELLGPKRPEYYKLIPVTVIYCAIFFTGIIGNICTCIVIARNRYMQTATNYYLFNLAVADLLVLLLGLPQETYTLWSAYPWIFGETFCIVRSMAAETSTYASILTITAFTMERYVAICHPMRSQTLSSLKRAIKVVVLLWFVSAICAIPIVVQYGVVYIPNPANGKPIPESAICSIRPDRYLRHTFEVATFLFFLTPMTVISALYILIGLAIRRSTLSRKGSDSSNHSKSTGTELRALQQARARRAVLKMLGKSCQISTQSTITLYQQWWVYALPSEGKNSAIAVPSI